MNAFGGRMRQELVENLEAIKGSSDVRVVVITGADKAFCTGGDLREFADGTVQALDYEVYVLEMLRKSRDVAEGIAAFLEKRDPPFEGR